MTDAPAALWDAMRDLMNLAAAARLHDQAAAPTRDTKRPDDGSPDELADVILAPPGPGEQWPRWLLEEGVEIRQYVRQRRAAGQREAARAG